jgi:hypothetical protein
MIFGLVKMQFKIMAREFENLIVGIGIPLIIMIVFIQAFL